MREKINNIFRFDYGLKKDLIPVMIVYVISEFYYKAFISENMHYSILPISKKKAMENIFLQIGISLLIYLIILGSSIYNMVMTLDLMGVSENGILPVLYALLGIALTSMLITTIGINLDIFISKHKLHKYIRITINGVVMLVIANVIVFLNIY